MPYSHPDLLSHQFGFLASFKCMHMHCDNTGTTTITITDDAYRALKAEKKDGESFSDVILRKFQKGNPSAILAVVRELGPNNDLADAIEEASKELRKNFRLRRINLDK